MKSAFGIEHEEISKSDFPSSKRERTQRKVAGTLGALPVASGVATGVYSATQAKKGRKAAVAGRTVGRAAISGATGASLGGLAGLALTRSSAGYRVGGALGGLAGFSHGARHAMGNAQRRGDIYKSAFGVEHEVGKGFGSMAAKLAKTPMAGKIANAGIKGTATLKPMAAKMAPMAAKVKAMPTGAKVGAGLGVGAIGGASFERNKKY